MMASKAERKEEWSNRVNKGKNNESWVKTKENVKQFLKGEELYTYSKSGEHYDLSRGQGNDKYKIECKSNNGNLSKPQRKERDQDPEHYKIIRTKDGTNPIHGINELVRKIKKNA